MDAYSKYLLDQIEKYRNESLEEPDEKDINEALQVELMQALVKYQNCIAGGVK